MVLNILISIGRGMVMQIVFTVKEADMGKNQEIGRLL